MECPETLSEASEDTLNLWDMDDIRKVCQDGEQCVATSSRKAVAGIQEGDANVPRVVAEGVGNK